MCRLNDRLIHQWRIRHECSIKEQAEQVLKKFAAVLATEASSLANVLHAKVHLADPKRLERIESVYARAFADQRPTRTIISNRAFVRDIRARLHALKSSRISTHRLVEDAEPEEAGIDGVEDIEGEIEVSRKRNWERFLEDNIVELHIGVFSRDDRWGGAAASN